MNRIPHRVPSDSQGVEKRLQKEKLSAPHAWNHNRSRWKFQFPPAGVMSNWEVDDVADSSLPAWSSFDVVEWIEGEIKEGQIVQETELQRNTPSKDPFGEVGCESSLPAVNQMCEVAQACASPNFIQKPTTPETHSSESPGKVDGKNAMRATEVSNQSCSQVTTDYSDSGLKMESLASLDLVGNASEEKTDCILDNATGNRQPSISNSSSVFLGSGLGEEPEFDPPEYDLQGDMELYKEGTDYEDAAADVGSQFLLSDIYTGGGLDFLEEESDRERRDNLLEYGWDNTNNLVDMDRLFLNSDSMLSRGFDDTSDGILWEPPSPTGPGSICKSVKEASSPIFIQKACGDDDSEVDFIRCKAVPENVKEEMDTTPAEESVFNYSHLQLTTNMESPELPVDVEHSTQYGKDDPWEEENEGRCSDTMEDEGLSSLKESAQEIKMRPTSASPMEENSMQLLKEGEKGNKARKHRTRPKKFEENARKQILGRKLSVNISSSHSKKSPLSFRPTPQNSGTSVSHVTRLSNSDQMSHVQHMQPVPYIHAGFGFPAHHHMPVLVPGPPVLSQQLQPQAQPVFIGYQTPFVDAAKIPRAKVSFEVPSQSPNVRSTMTPQEKIEKLRWRQKMQARLAVEQQQQQLMNQRLIPEQPQFSRQSSSKQAKEGPADSVRPDPVQSAEPSVWNDAAVSPSVVADDGDESLAASVLQQLLNITSKMDMRTRLCLRDGFRRLAGNALQRHTASEKDGGNKGSSTVEPYNRSDSSSSSDKNCSQRTLTVEDIVETQTNPVDRFIAHLLFHKQCPSSSTSDYMDPNPPGNTILENSKVDLLDQSRWAWSESVSPSVVSPTTHSSTTRDGLLGSCGPDAALEATCNNLDYTNGSGSHFSVVSGVQQEGSSSVHPNVTDSCLTNNKTEVMVMDSSSGSGDNISRHGNVQ